MSDFNEPWKIDDGHDLVDCLGHFLELYDDRRIGLSLENMARVVACVNACEGIPTDDVVETIELWKEFYFRSNY